MEKKMETGEYLEDVREMAEYKVLFARFKSLFLWPGFISTVVPPHIRHIPEIDDGDELEAEKPKPPPKKKRKFQKYRLPQGRPTKEQALAAKIARENRQNKQMLKRRIRNKKYRETKAAAKRARKAELEREQG